MKRKSKKPPNSAIGQIRRREDEDMNKPGNANPKAGTAKPLDQRRPKSGKGI